MNKSIQIPIQIENEEYIPTYGSQQAAGADLRANNKETLILKSGTSALIPTGIRLEIPEGYEVQVRPRSGLALKNQITVLNTPGTIDADYRGEVCVILMNHGKEDFAITPGMRIAQMVVAPVIQAQFVSADVLSTTARGTGGFGHTGTH